MSWRKVISIFLCSVMILLAGCKKEVIDVQSSSKANENTITTVVEKVPIEFVTSKYNELIYSGIKYNIKTFRANFTIKNIQNKDLKLKLRIPINSEEALPKEDFFAFIDQTGKELTIDIAANEEKSLNLNQENYSVVGYVGDIELGVMNGKVFQIFVDYGDGFVSVLSDEALELGIKNEVRPEDINAYDPFTLEKLQISAKENAKLQEEQKELQYKIEELIASAEISQDNGTTWKNEIQEAYSIFKYQGPSGLKKYLGDSGLRVYPTLESPIVHPLLQNGTEEIIVFCRAVADIDGRAWGLIELNNYGDMKLGFIPYDELEAYEKPDLGEGIESIGGFKLNDRIEKLIGIIDNEFTVASENLCIYTFPDEPYATVEPINNVFSGIKSLDAFVSNDFRVWLIRTDSPNYTLDSGFKVGDNAKDVLAYYEKRYKKIDIPKDQMYMNFATGDYVFTLSESEEISFSIDTETLTDKSVITNIYLY